jgi:hypothetical protein
VRRRWRLVGVEVMGADHVGQHQDCRDCIPDILAVSEFFYREMGEISGSRGMAEVRRLMRRVIDSYACQRCLSRSSSLSFSALHRLCSSPSPGLPQPILIGKLSKRKASNSWSIYLSQSIILMGFILRGKYFRPFHETHEDTLTGLTSYANSHIDTRV